MRRRQTDSPDSSEAAWAAGVQMLARRELSASQVRTRLARHGYSPAAVEAALARLRASGTLDDARVARASATTRLQVKRQGRERVRRELAAMGIDRETADRAVAEVFGEADERALLERALERRLRTGMSLADPAVRRRLSGALMRQGFSAESIAALFHRRRGPSDEG
jgi:regulatory protein